MKRNMVIYLVVAVIGILSLFGGACAKPAPAPTPIPTQVPTPVPTPTPTPTSSPAPAKPIVLRASLYPSTTSHQYYNIMKPWADWVEKNSAGRIKVEIYSGEALGKAEVQYDLVASGAADAAMFVPTRTPGRFPLNEIMGLPFIASTAEQADGIYQKLLQARLSQEFSKVEVLATHAVPPYHIMTVKRAIRNLGDMTGLRIRVSGGYEVRMLELLGAGPISMSGAEMYTSLERGILDGALTGYTAAQTYRLQDLVKYVSELGIGTNAVGWIMHKPTYEQLSPDLRKVIDDSRKYLKERVWYSYRLDDGKTKDDFIKKGIEVISFSTEQIKPFRDRVMPIWDEWVKSTEAKGLPGRAVMDELKRVSG